MTSVTFLPCEDGRFGWRWWIGRRTDERATFWWC